MATVNYTCPNCAAPLKFNPDKQMFSCEYCMSDFTEKYVQDFFAKKEQRLIHEKSVNGFDNHGVLETISFLSDFRHVDNQESGVSPLRCGKLSVDPPGCLFQDCRQD